ncbi:MAG: hypothetical protein ACE5GO_06005, partial [Anaerolineales bacterium]
PKPGDYDPVMRRETAASMLEHGFFLELESTPNLLLDKVWIGLTQLRDSPLYFIFASIPIRLFKYANVETQLLASRLLSLAMYLATLAIAYGLVCELTPEGSKLRWAIPLTMALTPAFTDLMTAINNDVGATLFFSAFLWIGVRILMRGITLKRLSALILVSIACFYTKKTVFIALPLAAILMVLSLSQAPKPWKWLPFPLLFGLLIVTGATLLARNDAASWYRKLPTKQQTIPTKIETQDASSGKRVIQIHLTPLEERGLVLFQPFGLDTVELLRSQRVTLGAWVWATESIQIQGPSIWVDGNSTTQQIQVTTTPTFFAISAKIPRKAERVHIVLDPKYTPTENEITVFYDSVVFVEGNRPITETPVFHNDKGAQGEWGGEEFANLIRNPSVEDVWLTIRPKHWMPCVNTQVFQFMPSRQCKITG